MATTQPSPILRSVFRRWFPLAVGATLLSIMVYGVAQQSFRQAANDPQIQIARDVAAALGTGVPATSLVSGSPTDLSKSLGTFTLILNDKNQLMIGSGILGGKVPIPPSGVLDTARANGENILTWQPKVGVRIAAVAQKVAGSSGMVVVVGRSMKLVEQRIGLLGIQVFVGWLVTLVGALVAVWLTDIGARKSS